VVHGGRKRFLSRLFRHVEVAEELDQGRNDPTPFGTVDRIDGGIDVCHYAGF
jgi:hypothetical protein